MWWGVFGKNTDSQKNFTAFCSVDESKEKSYDILVETVD